MSVFFAIQTRDGRARFVCPGYVTTLRENPNDAIKFDDALMAHKYLQGNLRGPAGEGMRIVKVTIECIVEEGKP